MKIAELFRYIGRKHLAGVIVTDATIAAGTKLTVRPMKGGYELHTEPDEPTTRADAQTSEADHD